MIIFKEVKKYLKELASEIKTYKSFRPSSNRGDRELWRIELEINKRKYLFRHYHIACCELRGKTREQIEKPSISNPADERRIENIKKEIIEKYEIR